MDSRAAGDGDGYSAGANHAGGMETLRMLAYVRDLLSRKRGGLPVLDDDESAA